MKMAYYSFLLVTVLLASSFFQKAQADVISIRSDKWCPYACDSATKPGYMVEIAREIFAKHGHRIEFKTANWVNAIKDTRANKVNALIGCSRADAPDFIFPSLPLGQLENQYFVKKTSTWTYNGRQSLVGKKIGVVADYSYGDAIDNLIKIKHPSLVFISGRDALGQIIQMMKEGLLDAFVESPTVLRYTLAKKKWPLDSFKSVSTNLANDPDLYLAFSPNNPKSAAYAEIFSRGIEELRKSGELKKIMERYSLTDWLRSQVNTALGVDDLAAHRFHGPLDLLDVVPTGRL